MDLDDYERVGKAVRHLLAQHEPFDLPSWNAGIDQAALRAGLLLCGDVTVASTALEADGMERELDAEADRLTLILFAVSPLHQSLRKDLGLAIQ